MVISNNRKKHHAQRLGIGHTIATVLVSYSSGRDAYILLLDKPNDITGTESNSPNSDEDSTTIKTVRRILIVVMNQT